MILTSVSSLDFLPPVEIPIFLKLCLMKSPFHRDILAAYNITASFFVLYWVSVCLSLIQQDCPMFCVLYKMRVGQQVY